VTKETIAAYLDVQKNLTRYVSFRHPCLHCYLFHKVYTYKLHSHVLKQLNNRLPQFLLFIFLSTRLIKSCGRIFVFFENLCSENINLMQI